MLTQRQKKILQAIVRQYTSTGQPVGSKHLAEKLPFKVSSATVRNEMAVLEDNDLILKEHSSSGRIPSNEVTVIMLIICLIHKQLLIMTW